MEREVKGGLIAVFHVTLTVGTLCLTFSLLFLIPSAVELIHNKPFWPFLFSAIWSALIGAILVFAQKAFDSTVTLNIKKSFIITTISWFVLCILASIPLVLGDNNLCFVDAIFEAVSATTGTGASVISNLEQASPGVLIWRAMLQWIGGIGIMVIALVLFPFLHSGSMQILSSEFSDKNASHVLPKISQMTKSLLGIYLFFTILCMILLFKAGMGWFDAICHGLTVVSTGGFSTKTQSIASFNSSTIELICIPFMIIGGCNLILFIRLLKGEVKGVLQDRQLKLYLQIVFVATMIFLLGTGRIENHHTIIKDIFNAVSIVTTSGFAAEDYTLNSTFVITFIIWASLIGGCTGSTAGGIKIFRIQIVFEQITTSLKKTCFPNMVIVPVYNGQELERETFFSVSTYLSLFVFTFFLSSMALAWFGLDLAEAFSTTISMITNLGPGFTTASGPFGSFAHFSKESKIVMVIVMILGRLEFVTLLILFTRGFLAPLKIIVMISKKMCSPICIQL